MVADATDILAVSGIAATDVFGKRVLTDKRYSLHPAGIDLAPFARGAGAHAIRASLGLEASGRVVGHVGRFAHQKNHEFFVRVAAQVARARQDVAFLLVGDGPLRRETEDQVRREGLADRFRLVGGRSDVAELMCGAMDVLLFPSRHEGMGRVVVEAQAAGLPCVMSDVVSPEVDVIPPLIHRHSLADPADEWADTVMGVLAQGPPLSHADAHALVTASPYSITTSIRALEQMYAAARRVDA